MALDMPDKADPAHYLFTCNVNPNMTSISNVTFMQIRRIHTEVYYDRTVYSRRRSRSRRFSEVIGRANISAHHGTVVANESLTPTGMIISGSIDQSDPVNSMLKIESWICEHAGEYVCDVFYTVGDKTDPKFAMAEIRVADTCGKTPISYTFFSE